MTTISVVIPTFRRAGPLGETLSSLRACDPPPLEIIVVDGDPARSAAPVVSGMPGDGVDIRHIATRSSVNHQRNVGAEQAAGDVVLFLDDDVDPAEDVFAVLGRGFDERGVVGATGRVIEAADGRVGGGRWRRALLGGPPGTFTKSGYPRYVTGATRRDVEFMPGCFAAARRDLALRVRFDEAMTGYALGEDEDFSYRLSRLGRIRYLPEASLEHRKIGFRTQDPRALGRLVVRNRAYLFRKNFSQTPLARLQFGELIVILVAHRLVNREWRGALGLCEGAVGLLRGSR
jgi:GT2 family glycosyltransferase